MSIKADVEKKDLLPELKSHSRADLEKAHLKVRNGIEFPSIPKVHQMDSTAVIWIVNPFIGISVRQHGDNVTVGLRCFLSDLCSTTLGPGNFKEVLTLDIFIVKAQISFSYRIKEKKLIWKGTACYRKIPSLEWRGISTGDQVILNAAKLMKV